MECLNKLLINLLLRITNAVHNILFYMYKYSLTVSLKTFATERYITCVALDIATNLDDNFNITHKEYAYLRLLPQTDHRLSASEMHQLRVIVIFKSADQALKMCFRHLCRLIFKLASDFKINFLNNGYWRKYVAAVIWMRPIDSNMIRWLFEEDICVAGHCGSESVNTLFVKVEIEMDNTLREEIVYCCFNDTSQESSNIVCFLYSEVQN